MVQRSGATSRGTAVWFPHSFHLVLWLICLHILKFSQGPVSRKCRKLFGPEKPFVKLQPAYFVKLVFSYVVKGIKIKITAKFRVSRRLRFDDTKRIMSPEMLPEKIRTFEKRAPDYSKESYEF